MREPFFTNLDRNDDSYAELYKEYKLNWSYL